MWTRCLREPLVDHMVQTMLLLLESIHIIHTINLVWFANGSGGSVELTVRFASNNTQYSAEIRTRCQRESLMDRMVQTLVLKL